MKPKDVRRDEMRQNNTHLQQVIANKRDDITQKILEIIEQARVTQADPSHKRKQLFLLVREVRTLVGFDKPIEDKFKKVVKKWQSISGTFLVEEPFDLLWAQFKTSWEKVKFSTDKELFCELVGIAYQSKYPPVCENYEDIARDLIRLCAVLDAHWSPEPFYLSCRMAEDQFGFSHAKMASLLQLLVMDGVLELVEKGKLLGHTGQTGRASRYRFLKEKGRIDLGSIKNCGQVSKEAQQWQALQN
jgi:hypothetical protein